MGVHADCPDKDSGEEFCEKSGFGKDECEDNAACCHWDDGACWYNEGGDGVSSSSNDGGDGTHACVPRPPILGEYAADCDVKKKWKCKKEVLCSWKAGRRGEGMCVHLFEARCYGSKNEKQCRKHRMKNERICKMDDCEECLKGFDDAGGCQAPPEDAHDYIPEGCDPCGITWGTTAIRPEPLRRPAAAMGY